MSADETFLFDFSQQFVVDVSEIDESARSRLRQILGSEAVAYLTATYVADMIPRAIFALEQIFEESLEDWDSAPLYQVPGSELRQSILTGIYLLKALDPVTSEIVRLRGAHHHDCRLCKSLRSVTALASPGNEALLNVVGGALVDGLPPRAAAAVALVDAMIWEPARIPSATIDAIQVAFTPPEAIEIVLDVMRNATNKIAVALGSDGARVESGVEYYEFLDDGTLNMGLPRP